MPRDVIAGADKPKGWSMLKKASDARASLGKSRAIAALGRVGRRTLVVIVLSLALIGFLHLTRGTAVPHARGVSADGTPINVSEPVERELPDAVAVMQPELWQYTMAAHGPQMLIIVGPLGKE